MRLNEVAKTYLKERGWYTVPLDGKSPEINKEWQHKRFEVGDLDRQFKEGRNIGLLLGKPSGGVIDIDLDSPEAVLLASWFLPRSGKEFGRASKGRTHLMYQCDDVNSEDNNTKSLQIKHPTDTEVDAEGKEKNVTIIELRSSGKQTMIPPSIHPDTNEEIVWLKDEGMTKVTYSEISKAVHHLAAAALIVPFWHTGRRQDMTLHLAGGLARTTMDESDIIDFIEAVGTAAGDDEIGDRRKAITDTITKIREGTTEHVTGLPSLAKCMGEHGDFLIKNFRTWMGIGPDVPGWYTPTKQGLKFHPKILAQHISTERPVILLKNSLIYLYDDGVYNRLMPSELDSIVSDYLIPTHAQPGHIDGTVRFLLSDIKNRITDTDDLNTPEFINLKNGLLNTATMELCSHTSKVLNTIQLRLDYDPTARCDRDAPNFHRYLQASVPEDTIPLVQEVMGYALSNHHKAKKFFLLMGPQDSGKSVFINIINRMFNERDLTAIPWAQLNDKFMVSHLLGSAINSFSDLSNRIIEDADSIKMLIGDDYVQADIKYSKERITFKNRATIMFSSNSKPKFTGDKSMAFFEKLIVLPFPNTIPHEDRFDVMKETKSEQQAIFNWAMKGLQRLMDNGFQFSVEDTESEKSHVLYQEESSPVLNFLKEECEVWDTKVMGELDTSYHSDMFTTRMALWQAFKDWSDDARDSRSMKKATFYSAMEEIQRDFSKSKRITKRFELKDHTTKRTPCYFGIMLKDSLLDTEEEKPDNVLPYKQKTHGTEF